MSLECESANSHFTRKRLLQPQYVQFRFTEPSLFFPRKKKKPRTRLSCVEVCCVKTRDCQLFGVWQHEFVNLSLPCESALIRLSLLLCYFFMYNYFENPTCANKSQTELEAVLLPLLLQKAPYEKYQFSFSRQLLYIINYKYV